MILTTTLVWLSPNDPAFPPQLGHYLGDNAPIRICTIGNVNILKSQSVALISSVKCPGSIILRTYDLAQRLRDAAVPVIGGFHSPMEQECLRIFLRGKQPVIVCPARGLHGMRIPSEHKQVFEQGRLLYVSPFSEKLRRATVETALLRNRLVAALADQIIVPYAAPDSKTFELCRLLISWGKPLTTLPNKANGALLKLGARPLEGTSDEFAPRL